VGYSSELEPRRRDEVATVVLDVEENEWNWSRANGLDLIDFLTDAAGSIGRDVETLTQRTWENHQLALVICEARGGDKAHERDVGKLYAVVSPPVNKIRADRTFASKNRVVSLARRNLAYHLGRSVDEGDYDAFISARESAFLWEPISIRPDPEQGLVLCRLDESKSGARWVEFGARLSGNFERIFPMNASEPDLVS